MTNSNEYSFKSQKSISRLELAWYIVLRSVAIGLISGGVLGVLFCLLFFVFTGMLGAGLGLGLGLVNGLLVSVITCLFFYPLRHIRLYHVTVKVISASVAGVGVAIFGPWYFSSTPMFSRPMTPSSAVWLGFGSVLASVIAGLAGWLAGQNISQWYEQKTKGDGREPIVSKTLHSTITPNKADQHLEAILSSRNWVWICVGLLSFLCSFAGNRLLQLLVCGTQDVVSCLPSPRLYTSIIAGYKVVLPVIVAIILIVKLLQSRYKKHDS
ncbi:MAG: hypothetical protein V7L21_12990 [Nostoc sp.]|uniref:hypothetical protein n=1 Tax=unclassified Nostoc TaxID=2593658 RepID=UPI0025E089BD|nr:hypothetical protein [Nostoc sp. NMS9]MBN3940267.1 hypothetical protein [Nostoc sp. NMS9]